MQINISKTKEMVLGRLNIDNLPLLSTSLGSVERITSFKLLGINVDAKLSRSLHINIISAKASPLSSDRQHLSYDVCLEVRGEIIRTVLFCIVY